MCKTCWTLNVILILIVAVMAYKFIIAGSSAPASDGRQSLALAPGERDLVLAEMRAFLQSVQAITEGVGAQDMERIAQAARRVGAEAQQAVPGSLIGKLPLAFKQLGLDTHKRFDTLALDAEQLGDPAHSLEQLSQLMQNCVACHSAYRIDAVAAAEH
jgi:cytochrome c556